MIAALLALGAGAAWGAADFLGGLKSRAAATVVVVAVAQASGLALVAALVAAQAEAPPELRFVVYGVLGGVAGAVGIGALYRGLAVGVMSIVAPISATGAAIPLVVGVASGERPSALQGVGLGVALVGVMLAAREEHGKETRSRFAVGVGLALVAAVGIGCFLLALDAASEGGVPWALLVQRATCLGIVVAVAAAVRPSLSLARADVLWMVAIGALDMTANGLFALASTRGYVSVVSVLASLYPVMTVALAWAVLGERVARLQRIGVASALVGVVLITAG